MIGALRLVPGILLLAAALALPAAQQNRKRTEQDLRTVTDRIERVQRQVAQDAVDKDRMNRDLREAERSVAKARGSLGDLRARRSERAAARQKLVDLRALKEEERRRDQAELANQLRAAYFMGQNESLQLLLNQSNSAEVSRNLAYYGYFGRYRAHQIAQLNEDVAQIKEITAKIDAEDAQLATLEQQQKDKVGQLDSARQQRGAVLASLQQESQSRATQLARLQKEQQQLERLLKQLSKATESVPFDPNAPFARLRGRLAWPVAGRVSVDFGDSTAGGLRSNGIEIETERGADVRAVQEGRVVYADWLPGRGLLVILDHGDGYLSLYGHNEQIFQQVGARVQAGEAIATAGDSGGRKTPGLYFEIRRAGKPVDPHGWFRSKEPPG
ncbi:MAG: peptidoglycan DD-metalloendopeptidase family protein [Pseudomonadota bacterium]